MDIGRDPQRQRQGSRDDKSRAETQEGFRIVAAVGFPVLQNIDARKTSGGSEPIMPVVRVNSSNYDAPASFEPGSNYHIHQEVWEKDPNTNAAWTLARLNDANATTRAYFGQKIP